MSAVRRRPRPDGHTRLPCSSGYRHAVIGGCTSVSAVVRSAPFAPSGSTTTTATTATAPAATAAAATTSPSGLALRAAQEATPRRHAERRQAGRQRERRAPGRPRHGRKAGHGSQPVPARNRVQLRLAPLATVGRALTVRVALRRRSGSSKDARLDAGGARAGHPNPPFCRAYRWAVQESNLQPWD